jgi:segregation and condensation protein A
MFKNVEDFTEEGTAKTSRYNITTTMFEGPLDLLLQLIEQAELDITRLALVEVTGPFLEYVRQIQAEKAEEVSSFLVIAARLMQIKSEALLPRPPDREPGEEDPSTELLNQLITYKKFKEIAKLLAERNDKGLRTYLRLAPTPKVEAKLEDGQFDLDDLMRAARTALRILEEKQSVDTVIRKPRVTMQDMMRHIRQKLNTEGSATFSGLLGEDYTRVEVVVTFLALLELVRRFRIKAVQDDNFDDIRIVPSDDWDKDEEFEEDLKE